uniref:Uncharacterized protein n=1 Tax=Rhizophora mucronata TaxID=61149 RepID=A0A2P2PVZ0_RHIMU
MCTWQGFEFFSAFQLMKGDFQKCWSRQGLRQPSWSSFQSLEAAHP